MLRRFSAIFKKNVWLEVWKLLLRTHRRMNGHTDMTDFRSTQCAIKYQICGAPCFHINDFFISIVDENQLEPILTGSESVSKGLWGRSSLPSVVFLIETLNWLDLWIEVTHCSQSIFLTKRKIKYILQTLQLLVWPSKSYGNCHKSNWQNMLFIHSNTTQFRTCIEKWCMHLCN